MASFGVLVVVEGNVVGAVVIFTVLLRGGAVVESVIG